MQFGRWTFLDYAFALTILISVIFAMRKGLVRELISLAALVGGFILAAGHYDLPFLIATGFYVIGISAFYTAFRNVRPGEAGAAATAP